MAFLTKPYSWWYAWKTTSFQGSLLLVRESPTNEFAWEKLACSRPSDSRAREKNSQRKKKKRGETRGGRGENACKHSLTELFPPLIDRRPRNCDMNYKDATLPCLRPCPPRSCPQPMAVVAVIPNSLELGLIMARRGAKMMIVKIDSPTFPLITFIIRHGKSKKMKVSQSPLEESRKRPGLDEWDSSKFTALHEKIPQTGNAPLHCL